MRNLTTKLVVLLVLLSIPALMMAQEIASVTGVVTDVSGAVIPGVQITLLNTRTNATFQAVSSPTGTFTITRVPPGPGYKLSFSLKGFETLVVNELYLGVGAVRTQNAELKVGSLSQEVSVSAVTEDITLNTTNAAVGNNFNMISVNQLPVQIRDNPAALLQLQPGVVNATSGGDGLGSRAGSVTGARGDQNNVYLDGLDVNDFATGQAFSTVANAPVDSIQEFRGETAGSLAASGRGSGGQIQMVTKSGTNVFHGSLAEYHRNTATAANSYFNKVAGVKRPKLIRNQFGATFGGPVIKNKLFFFFNYNGRRDAYDATSTTVVPLDSFRNGNINYILKTDPTTGLACTASTRLNTTPNCVGTKTSAQVAAIDPQHVGFNSALMTFVNGRYPHANDLTGGDGLNTGYFRFNAPVSRVENDYVTRIDYNINNDMKLFGRFSILRDTYGDNVNYAAPMQFPGDPLTHSIANKSYAFVIGHTWTINSLMVNQFTYGKTVSKLGFPASYNPTGTTYWSFGGGLTSPYSDASSQARVNPIPVFKDDLTWQKGKHQIQIGGTFKPILTTSTLVNDFNTVGVGLGGLNGQLSASLRPTDIRGGTTAPGYWDSTFAFALGRISSVGSNWNYNGSLTVQPQGKGATRQYRYFETEPYIQDTWKMTNNLTVTYGIRYQYYSVPYEVNGQEATQNFGFNDYLFGRVANGMKGVSGVDTVPITYYNLAGSANHTRGLYEPNLTNFAPRLSFAYNPAAEGWLKPILGDHKTVIRAGAGIVYDHPVVNALNFIQDQNSYMFQSSSSRQFGATSPTTALLNDPRFTAVSTIPTPAAAPTVDRPFAPFVTGGVPDGLANNQFNYAIDPNLKTPYSVVVNFGFQRELPGHFVIESTYVGRFGRRLIAQADASQLVDFKDPVSGQLMSAAFANLQGQVRNGAGTTGGPALVPVPWFENQSWGGTALIASYLGTYLQKGDIADSVQWMAANGLIDYNVGMPAQFAGNTYITNRGSSNYHGLLTSLHKNMSHGLQFDLNYTFSHSIDNVSMIGNSIASSSGLGFICDATQPRVCRGNSDFDMTHIINGNFIYDMPFGKGKAFGGNSKGWVDQLIGGWNVSGVPTWRTGIAFSSVTGAWMMGYANNAPALFNGDQGALAVHVHRAADGSVQMFKDPVRAVEAYSNPYGFTMGSRNNLRGPGYFNMDMALGKRFPVTEKVGIQFRSEAYNVFNHPNFGLPGGGAMGSGADINSGVFGKITSQSGSSRVMQFSLRVEF